MRKTTPTVHKNKTQPVTRLGLPFVTHIKRRYGAKAYAEFRKISPRYLLVRHKITTVYKTLRKRE